MAKKKTQAKAKSTGKKTKGTASSTSLGIERGGEPFILEKSADLFAVKKKPRSVRGNLSAAEAAPESFPQLRFRSSDSGREMEVYQVAAASIDKAMDTLRRASSDIEWCAHIYHMPGDPDGIMIPTDAIYVELAADAKPDAINALLEEYHLEVMRADDDLPNAYVVRLTSASTANPIKIANGLRGHKSVKLAEPDFSMRMALAAYRPSDSLFTSQWHLENNGGIGLTAGADVKAPDAWEITRGDRSVVVCIMDDGVQTDHPDFSSPGKHVAPYDFGEDDLDPRPVLSDDNHGTACAGVAVADENGSGVVGLAPGCAMMPIRTSGMISDSTIEALFNHARSKGADVISCSWGVASEFFTLSTRMKRAISRAASDGRNGRGCVILFAAGNEDVPVNGKQDGKNYRSGFAIHPDVIAVSASNSHDRRSHYSNYGPEIWVCAPSSGSGGRRIVTTDRSGSSGYQQGDYTTSNGFGGTSSSTPLVAGLCGLLLSVNPELTAEEVKQILRETSDKIDPSNGNYTSEGHSDEYGWGRINAGRAVRLARDQLAPLVNRQVSFHSNPGLAIPDNNAVGISDSIHVAENAQVRGIQVSVNIEHTYQGDLQIKLTAPDGSEAMLHDRQGSGRDDLVRTFDTDDTPSLSHLTGQSAHGDWVLSVSDRASIDTGILNGWGFTLGLDGAPSNEWEASPGLHIPDHDAMGIASQIDVDGHGHLTDIALTVDITHTWRGDLEVTLESPVGMSAAIHQMQGGSEDNLQRTYQAADTQALAALVDAGVEINGIWKLRVADKQSQDVGKLNAWKLALKTG
ncbi:MAG: S8 family serine peptidase [Gammaproteobacteria bacterium]|nr:S8 family serine peptidase [Gammaproteobacteria bacterium]